MVQITKHYFTKNQCYKVGQKMVPKGFMIHSTGANNPYLWRYIDDAPNLGKNKYGNHWNQYQPDGRQVCVHGFIGKDKRGNVKAYNTLPENIVGWHGGFPANNKYIAYEICEDNLKNKKYFNAAMNKAMDVAAFYCKQYGWTSDKVVSRNVLSHKEGHDRGEATNHGDIDYWLKKQGKTMDWFRAGVKERLQIKPDPKPTIVYQSLTKGSKKWNKNIKNYKVDVFTGVKGKGLTAFGIYAANTKENTPCIKYRVKPIGKDYYNWQIDRAKDKNGENYAGDTIHRFDRIQMSLKGCTGWKVKYRVYAHGKGWLSWVTDYNNENDNGYAGWDGCPIECIQVQIVKD